MDGPSDVKAEPVYISVVHAERAVGYLGIAMAVRGILSPYFPFRVLHELWDESVKATTIDQDKPPSPIQGSPS